ncbi:NADPH:quinone reductase [Mycobacterium colombiense]|uniref:NADP-dependent oxidoreductase n=1 Tax=Mycobacterium colombiense TaxID=339268 RepID=UPI0007EF799F|nr:NADP-dependent oxidoreductase [Mycobacterium colombiense]OBK63211.1 NADPH:quinone reductase [Mycobacterium colombiense]
MRAIFHSSFGGPEVLKVVELPRPDAGSRQVLLRMRATSVNPVDWKLRSGVAPHHLKNPPYPVGFDVSGTVVEIGTDVDGIRVGDEVFGMVASRTGTHSDYVLACPSALVQRPANVDDVHAAALATAGTTAWQALQLSRISRGDRVLIHAAAGGVGHLAVQLAKTLGAHVVGTARGDNHEFLFELGADELVDYTATDFAAAIDPVDVVLDLVGGDYGQRSLSVLRPSGRYIATRDSDARHDPRHQRVHGRPNAVDLAAIAQSVRANDVRVHVDVIMPLDRVADAHTLSEHGRVRGKIALTPWL